MCIRRKEKKKYPRHLTIRITVGIIITLLFSQGLFVAINALSTFIFMSAQNVQLASSVFNTFRYTIDTEDLKQAIHDRKMSDTLLVQQNSMQSMVDSFSQFIRACIVLTGNDEDGYVFVMKLIPGEENTSFFEPAPGFDPNGIEVEDPEENSGILTFSLSSNTPDELGLHLTDEVNDFDMTYCGLEDLSDPSDENRILLVVAVNLLAEAEANFAWYLINVGILLILTLLMIILLVFKIRRRVVRPLKKVQVASESFVDQTKASNDPNQWNYETPEIKTKDEIQCLADSVESMADGMKTAVVQLVDATRENARIGTELNLATRIQSSMLPNVFPPFPDRKEFDIFASMSPAKEVGGDFYDFFMIDDDHLGLVMADVSGKGVPAALFMMSSKLIIQNLALEDYTPAEVLTRANEKIVSSNTAEMFVTVWFGILEISTGVIRAVNAGHEYPVIGRADSGFELLKDKHGFVIGELEGIQYQSKEYEIRLEKGDALFLYTDGVPEAQNPAQEFFGTEQLVTALNQNPGGSSEEILRTVTSAVSAFRKEADPFDDMTMLCIRYNGPE